jgi:hypothetical protein
MGLPFWLRTPSPASLLVQPKRPQALRLVVMAHSQPAPAVLDRWARVSSAALVS